MTLDSGDDFRGGVRGVGDDVHRDQGTVLTLMRGWSCRGLWVGDPGLGDSLGGRWLCLLDAWVGSCEFVMVWMVVLGRDVLLMYG